MAASCDFENFIKIGPVQLEHLQQVGAKYPGEDTPEASAALAKEVKAIEGFVIQAYKFAVSIVKKEKDLKEIATIWDDIEKFCSSALEVVSKLKDKYPRCGTPALYDLILDYKLECKKRLNNVTEEMECQNQPIPTGLFPEKI